MHHSCHTKKSSVKVFFEFGIAIGGFICKNIHENGEKYAKSITSHFHRKFVFPFSTRRWQPAFNTFHRHIKAFNSLYTCQCFEINFLQDFLLITKCSVHVKCLHRYRLHMQSEMKRNEQPVSIVRTSLAKFLFQ